MVADVSYPAPANAHLRGHLVTCQTCAQKLAVLQHTRGTSPLLQSEPILRIIPSSDTFTEETARLREELDALQAGRDDADRELVRRRFYQLLSTPAAVRYLLNQYEDLRRISEARPRADAYRIFRNECSERLNRRSDCEKERALDFLPGFISRQPAEFGSRDPLTEARLELVLHSIEPERFNPEYEMLAVLWDRIKVYPQAWFAQRGSDRLFAWGPRSEALA